MVGKFKFIVLAAPLMMVAAPSFAQDVVTPITTSIADLTKGLATLDPVAILTPKPIEAPAAAAPAAKVKKKRYAKKRMLKKKKMAKT